MRPHYETKRDREVEREIMATLMRGSANRAKRLPDRNRINWAIEDAQGLLYGWAECRRRYCAHDKYPTFMMSLRKWDDGLYLTAKGGKPVYIVVEWDDGIFYVRQSEALDHISHGFGGRTDRGDPKDVEPCVYIPVNLFKLRAVRSRESEPFNDANASFKH